VESGGRVPYILTERDMEIRKCKLM
jgi:hypothetical protein